MQGHGAGHVDMQPGIAAGDLAGGAGDDFDGEGRPVAVGNPGVGRGRGGQQDEQQQGDQEQQPGR